MKVLIAGATGNLGSELVRVALTNGWSVKELSRENWSEIDSIFEQFDAVIHAAGNVRSDPLEHVVDFIDSNLKITADILELCKRTKSHHFVFISSCAVYGRSPESVEMGPCDPISLNGKFKLMNETLISDFCARHNIKSSSLRLFNLFGGNDKFSLIFHLRESIINNRPFLLKNKGNSLRDFIHVADAAKLILPVILCPKPPSILNIGSSNAISVGSIVKLARQLRPEIKVKHENADEIIYSCACMSKYRSHFGEFHCTSVLDHLPQLLK